VSITNVALFILATALSGVSSLEKLVRGNLNS